ncbi:Transposase for insertion sequence element IS905 [Bienertia sinuspersici]
MQLVADNSIQSNPPVFQRLFNCFDGLRKGWKEGCRRLICVDAAFLKTFLGGQILSAIGRDPNDQMFPIAWEVVEGENNQSWEWFFTQLQSCLELGDGSGIAIISDEHQAILNVVATVLPQAEHRHCARHVYAHWQKKGFRGDEMKLAFWTIAKAYNMTDFTEALSELEESNPVVAHAFRSYRPENFCRAYMDPSIKCDVITNNMAETFNRYIIQARTQHLLYMMEEIRGAIMRRICTKKQEMEKVNSMLCPKIQKMLEKEKDFTANCEVIPSTDTIFNVHQNLDTLVVNLSEKSCTYGKWNMTGIPCCHAVACIFFLNRDAEEYVDQCYTKEVYLQCYSYPVPVIEGERHWPIIERNLAPPPIKIGPGRPRKNRIKDPFENPKKPGHLTRHGMEMTCKLCNKKGHNKRGCPDKDTAVPPKPQPKRPRGRPKKYPAPNDDEAFGSFVPTTAVPSHHEVSANPTQLGKGGRMILSGEGARGRGQGRGRGSGRARVAASTIELATDSGSGRARGVSGGRRGGRVGGSATSGNGRGSVRGRGQGRNQVPRGFISPDGRGVMNVRDSNGVLSQVDVVSNQYTQPSQTSSVINNTPRS